MANQKSFAEVQTYITEEQSKINLQKYGKYKIPDEQDRNFIRVMISGGQNVLISDGLQQDL